MSLRDFHILFVTASILLSFGFSYWGFSQYQHLHDRIYGGVSFLSLLAAMGLAFYEITFIKKTKP